MKTELCAYSVDACRIAARLGVDRVELCASPAEGGVTPSMATIERVAKIDGIDVCIHWLTVGPFVILLISMLAFLVSSFSGFKPTDKDFKAKYISDGLHPTQEGHYLYDHFHSTLFYIALQYMQ